MSHQDLQAETLIEYKVINVRDLDVPEDVDEQRRYIETITSQIGNEPVELTGKFPDIFLALLFVRLRAIAMELVYSDEVESEAQLIFSLENDPYIIRPERIRQEALMDSVEIDYFLRKNKEGSKQKSVNIDISSVWKKCQESCKEKEDKRLCANKKLVSFFFGVVESDVVELSGIVANKQLLLALEMLMIKHSTIFYNGIQITR